jgi:hypothetical protein
MMSKPRNVAERASFRPDWREPVRVEGGWYYDLHCD